ncbi:uncharacterized protein LOC107402359 [Peromyscus maniculatus bairdii]|uniref:uncharacterized protein LOC107402359 n=1 Tax=Peromyscus maniculatus bairdii TaxID=230844 RepID=UPI003FD4707A
MRKTRVCGEEKLSGAGLETRGPARVQQAGAGYFHKKAATQLEAARLPLSRCLLAPTARDCPTQAPLDPELRQALRCGLVLQRRGLQSCPTRTRFQSGGSGPTVCRQGGLLLQVTGQLSDNQESGQMNMVRMAFGTGPSTLIPTK